MRKHMRLADLFGGEVQIGRGARPAPAVELSAILLLNEEALAVRLLVDWIARVLFDVRVDNGHHLTARQRQVLLHLHGLWELVLVPPVPPGASRGSHVREQVRRRCKHVSNYA